MVWTGPMSLPELTTVAPLFPQQWIDRYSPTSLWIEVHRVPYLPDPFTPDPPRCVTSETCAQRSSDRFSTTNRLEPPLSTLRPQRHGRML